MTHIEGAVCAQVDPEVMFPAPQDKATTRIARDLCNSCPGRDECLATALAEEGDDSYRWGIRGGLTPTERRNLRKRQAAAERAAAGLPEPPPRRRPPGPRLKPCGTAAAYERHRQAGETPCDPCREAYTAARRRSRERQRAAAQTAA
ncbi:WhiB family transcriptional regulator [Streptomyces sp. NPDC054784]